MFRIFELKENVPSSWPTQDNLPDELHPDHIDATKFGGYKINRGAYEWDDERQRPKLYVKTEDDYRSLQQESSAKMATAAVDISRAIRAPKRPESVSVIVLHPSSENHLFLQLPVYEEATSEFNLQKDLWKVDALKETKKQSYENAPLANPSETSFPAIT